MPTALIVAVLKAIVQFCSRFELFKIRFYSKTENPKEPSGYLLTESAFVSSWPVAQWDWHVLMAWECQVLQSLTLSPLLHVGGCSLVMALVARSGWKLRDRNVLPRFAFLSASFCRSPIRGKKKKKEDRNKEWERNGPVEESVLKAEKIHIYDLALSSLPSFQVCLIWWASQMLFRGFPVLQAKTSGPVGQNCQCCTFGDFDGDRELQVLA